jgi:hypothetical protein
MSVVSVAVYTELGRDAEEDARQKFLQFGIAADPALLAFVGP